MITQSFLYKKVLLKYERGKASDIDIRRGQKECPLDSLRRSYIPISKLLLREKKCLKPERVAPIDSLKVSHLEPKVNLEERQISKQIHSSLT